MMNKIKNYITLNKEKIKIDSKKVMKGDVFLTLKGKKTHGDKYISDAIKNGAKYVVVDRCIKKYINNKNVIVVDDVMNFALSVAKYKRNLFKGVVIGITGSIGKTSVKENLRYLLSIDNTVSASIKSYNNYLGVIISLLNMDLKSDFSLFEIGTNNFFEIRILSSIIMPSQVVITNIFPTHLEKLINTRNVAIEKADLINKKYNSKANLLVLPNNNNDEKFIQKLAKKQSLNKIITFGKTSNSDLIVKKINKIDNNFFEVLFSYDNKSVKLTLNINQYYRFYNIIICFIIFTYNKLNIKKLLESAKNLSLIEGRGFQSAIIINKKSVNLIDESYNASPESMKICIKYFHELRLDDFKKKYLILGDMKELGDDSIKYHKEIINFVIQKKIHKVIICGKLMKLALDKKYNKNIQYMGNLKSIIEYLKKNIDDNDFVLIKGSNSSLTNKLSQYLLSEDVI